MLQWEGKSIFSVIILLKMSNTNLIVRKHQTNSNWGEFYKISGFKSIKDMKDKKDWAVVTDWKRMWTAKYNLRFWIGSWATKSEKRSLEHFTKFRAGRQADSILSMLIFWFQQLCYCYIRYYIRGRWVKSLQKQSVLFVQPFCKSKIRMEKIPSFWIFQSNTFRCTAHTELHTME